MNIQTVADNLKRTIAGKQAMLDGLKLSEKEGYFIIKNWLEINIEELEKILKDVEQCKTTDVYEYNSDPYDGPVIKMFRED